MYHIQISGNKIYPRGHLKNKNIKYYILNYGAAVELFLALYFCSWTPYSKHRQFGPRESNCKFETRILHGRPINRLCDKKLKQLK